MLSMLLLLMQMLPSSIETRMARRCSVNSHDARTNYGERRLIVLQWDERQRVVDLLQLFHQSTPYLKTRATFFTIRECVRSHLFASTPSVCL